MTWVQLLRSQQIEKAGVSRTYYPGDWVDIGQQTARRWVTDNAARYSTPAKLDALLGDCGVALLGATSRAGKLRDVAPTLAVKPVTEPQLLYARTLIWQTGFALRPELVPVGFKLLEAWEVAAPLVSYEQLAAHIGTPEARARTEAVVRDLRVPVYESRLLFIRRCRAGQELLSAWAEERVTGDDDRLCLLRALYRVKPLLCALPTTWSKVVAPIQ